jgi:hypothetical protein
MLEVIITVIGDNLFDSVIYSNNHVCRCKLRFVHLKTLLWFDSRYAAVTHSGVSEPMIESW